MVGPWHGSAEEGRRGVPAGPKKGQGRGHPPLSQAETQNFTKCKGKFCKKNKKDSISWNKDGHAHIEMKAIMDFSFVKMYYCMKLCSPSRRGKRKEKRKEEIGVRCWRWLNGQGRTKYKRDNC